MTIIQRIMYYEQLIAGHERQLASGAVMFPQLNRDAIAKWQREIKDLEERTRQNVSWWAD